MHLYPTSWTLTLDCWLAVTRRGNLGMYRMGDIFLWWLWGSLVVSQLAVDGAILGGKYQSYSLTLHPAHQLQSTCCRVPKP
jgi:hypothetical protein